MEIKVGFWIKDFHVLQTEVEMIIDLSGNRRRIWVTMSSGKDSQLTLVSDIAAFHRERERERERLERVRIELIYSVEGREGRRVSWFSCGLSGILV